MEPGRWIDARTPAMPMDLVNAQRPVLADVASQWAHDGGGSKQRQEARTSFVESGCIMPSWPSGRLDGSPER